MSHILDVEDPTSNWMNKSSVLISESCPLEHTSGGVTTREILKVANYQLLKTSWDIYMIAVVLFICKAKYFIALWQVFIRTDVLFVDEKPTGESRVQRVVETWEVQMSTLINWSFVFLPGGEEDGVSERSSGDHHWIWRPVRDSWEDEVQRSC